MLVHLGNEKDFDRVIKDNKKVLVDFFANWCGPCKMLSPILEEVSNEEDIVVVKVDVDEFGDIASRFDVFSIPTLVLFKEGKQADKKVGYLPKDALLDFIK